MEPGATFSFISSRKEPDAGDLRQAAIRLGGVIDRMPYFDSTNALLRDVVGLLDGAADALAEPAAHPWDGKTVEELLAIALDCEWSPMVGRGLDARNSESMWLVSICGGTPRRCISEKGCDPRAVMAAAMKQMEQEIRKP